LEKILSLFKYKSLEVMNQQQTPVLKFAINWGLILGLVMIAMSLLFYFLGIHDNKRIGLLSFAIYVVVMYFAQKAYRDQNAGIAISYGRALWVGFASGLFATILVTFYNYIFFELIAPDFLTKMVEEAQLRIIEMDLPSEAEATALDSQMKFMTPGWIAIFGLFGSAFQSFIAALLGAIIAKGTTPAETDSFTDIENEA
jgi:hypothetical protein